VPLKDPVKLKAYERARYLKNKVSIKKRASDWYEANRAHVLEQHAQKSDILKEECKKWRNKNKLKVKAYKKVYEEENKEQTLIGHRKRNKKSIEKLVDCYVVHQIKQRTGLSTETIRNNPELIDNHRIQIIVKRLIKTKKDEYAKNTKTSKSKVSL